MFKTDTIDKIEKNIKGSRKIKDSEYFYASARLKALEVKNITRERFEKMIDMKSLDEAVAILTNECEYGDGSAVVSESTGAVNYEKLFASEQKKVYDLISELSPVPEILMFFKYQSDCHNIKSILKAEFIQKKYDIEDILLNLGSVDIATAKLEVRERTFTGFPENMAMAANDAVEAFSKNKDPMMIDIIMDKACFADMLDVAERSGCKFLIDLAKRKIDIVNIMITIRIFRMRNTIDLLKKTLIHGGTIEESIFIEAFEGQEEKFYDALKYTEYAALKEFAEANQEQNTLSQLEKLCEEIYFSHIKQTRYIPFGAEVVIGYIASKEMEIKNARIVMCGKETSLAGDVIRERLRAVYA